jgi:serine/threonine-protein kinase
VHGGDKIEMGRFEIPTNEHGELFINYNKPGSSFPEVSAADILSETFSISNLTGKLVIISATADNIMQFFQTPVSGKLRAVEKTANVIENIINSNYIKRLDSSPGRDVLILFALGSIFAFILPRVTLMYRLIIMFGSLFVLANINFVMFNSYNIMGRPLYLGLEIFLLFVACPFLDNELLAKLSTLRIGFAPPEESNRLPKAELPDENELPPVRRIKASPEENAATIEMRSPSAQKQLEKTTATDSSPVDAKQAATRMDTPVDGTEATSQMQTPPPPPREEKESISQSQTEFKSEDSAEFGLDNQAIKKLGRYEVVGKLGKGAMGMVYKGIDPAINRNVALKTIRLDFVNDPAELKELKERLTTEARAAGKLSHPNIVTIYDVGIEGTLQYIAMEYLEGQTLEDMIRHKTKFNFRIIAQMISQICSALEYAHNQAIVHRDIKPANLMVLKDLNIKVMDFGIARVDTSSMTRTGVAMGTPNYISPELLQGKPVDRRCDIFSLGVVIYELLLNRRPFKGENLTSLIYSIVNSDPEPPSKIDSSLPHVFDRVIAKALAKNPDERYQTAGEVAASLSDFIESFSAGRAKTM